MYYKEISIFKERTSEMEPGKTDPQKSRQEQKTEKTDQKKKEHTTKNVIVPARYFLACAAEEENIRFPVLLSLRYPDGGASRKIDSRTELTQIRKVEGIAKRNLVYFRAFGKILYLEFAKKGTYTIDKKWLPEIPHGAELSERDVKRLWKLLSKSAGKEQTDQKGTENGPHKLSGSAA